MTGKGWLTFLGIAVVLGSIHAWLVLGGWLALWAGLYAWSMKYKPRVRCSRCSGSGISEHSVLPWTAFGDCPKCGGKKSFVRLGVRVLQPDRARQLMASR